MKKKNYNFLVVVVVMVGVYGLISCNNLEEKYKKKYADLRAQIDEVKENISQGEEKQIHLSTELNSCKKDVDIAKKEYKKAKIYIKYDEDGIYTVQVESWRSEEKSIERAMYWRQKGYLHTHVHRSGNETTGDIWFSVRMGRVPTYQWSKKLHRLLQIEHNFMGAIYKINPDDLYNEFWN